MKKQWYETLFQNFANSYEKEVFTQGTIQEVDFIEKEIAFDKTKQILDVGCGTGRHSIELARRGYNVTGFDLSDDQLARAHENAVKTNVQSNSLSRTPAPSISTRSLMLSSCSVKDRFP